MGPLAIEAVNDLIKAGTAPWEDGRPQRFCETISALVRIAPRDPRLVGIIQPILRCSNYGIFKAAAAALAAIGTPAALDTIRWIDLCWGTARKDKLADELVQKTLDQCENRPLSGGLEPFSSNAGEHSFSDERIGGIAHRFTVRVVASQ